MLMHRFINTNAYLVLEDEWDIALFLTRHKAIQQDRQATDERLGYCSWACFADDHVTGCHPFRHVIHKALDSNLQATVWRDSDALHSQ